MAIQLLGHNAGMLVAAEVGSFDAPERVRGLGGLHTGAYGVGLLGALSCLPRPAHRSLWRRLAGCPFLLAAAAAAARRGCGCDAPRCARVGQHYTAAAAALGPAAGAMHQRKRSIAAMQWAHC
jgi:hypothetical protein